MCLRMPGAPSSPYVRVKVNAIEPHARGPSIVTMAFRQRMSLSNMLCVHGLHCTVARLRGQVHGPDIVAAGWHTLHIGAYHGRRLYDYSVSRYPTVQPQRI